MRAASVLFPAMADVDKAEIFNDFSSFQQQVADETKQDEASLLAVREYLEDEKEEHTSDSDGWNDKAVAAYNSLKPMLEVMETAMPACRRNFQGMLSVMRDEIERLMATVPEADVGDIRVGQAVTFTADAYRDRFTGRVRQIRRAATTTNNDGHRGP